MHTLWAPELYQNEPFDNNRDCWVYQTFQSLKCGWFSPYSPSLLLASMTLFKRFTVTLSILKTSARYIQLMITIREWILITRSLTRKVCHLVNKLLVIYPIYRNYCIVVKHNICIMVTDIKVTQIRSEYRIPFTDVTSTKDSICTLDHLPLQTFHLFIKSLEF